MAKVISQKRFITEALDAHNKYRKLHNVPPVELDPKLTELALEWAENLAEHGKLLYREIDVDNEPIGENILRVKTKYFSGEECTDEWYKEEANYKYDGKFSITSGHFTQLVWRNTKKVGFGFSTTEDGTFYVVANYFPAGNFKNEFHLNVSPKKDSYSANLTTKNDNNEYKPNTNEVKRSEQSKIEPRSFIQPKSDSPQERFIQEALHTHNVCRKKHGADPLVHNPELSRIAQNYADYLANKGTLIHSTNTYNGKKLGENLAYFYSSNMDYFPGENATMDWYNEIKLHKYADHQSGTGHFTQVVWKGSKEVGFGLAKARDGSFYAVANYYPPGNFIGQYSQNVSRPIY